jgi:hypothetical protein
MRAAQPIIRAQARLAPLRRKVTPTIGSAGEAR